MYSLHYFQILDDAKTYYKRHLCTIEKKLHLSGNPMIDPFNEIKAVFKWSELLTEIKSVKC